MRVVFVHDSLTLNFRHADVTATGGGAASPIPENADAAMMSRRVRENFLIFKSGGEPNGFAETHVEIKHDGRGARLAAMVGDAADAFELGR